MKQTEMTPPYHEIEVHNRKICFHEVNDDIIKNDVIKFGVTSKTSERGVRYNALALGNLPYKTFQVDVHAINEGGEGKANHQIVSTGYVNIIFKSKTITKNHQKIKDLLSRLPHVHMAWVMPAAIGHNGRIKTGAHTDHGANNSIMFGVDTGHLNLPGIVIMVTAENRVFVSTKDHMTYSPSYDAPFHENGEAVWMDIHPTWDGPFDKDDMAELTLDHTVSHTGQHIGQQDPSGPDFWAIANAIIEDKEQDNTDGFFKLINPHLTTKLINGRDLSPLSPTFNTIEDKQRFERLWGLLIRANGDRLFHSLHSNNRPFRVVHNEERLAGRGYLSGFFTDGPPLSKKWLKESIHFGTFLQYHFPWDSREYKFDTPNKSLWDSQIPYSKDIRNYRPPITLKVNRPSLLERVEAMRLLKKELRRLNYPRLDHFSDLVSIT